MVIAKSDVVIMAVSVSLLAAGIYRWQSNVSQVHERRTASSFPTAIQSGTSTSQRSNASSLAAKPDTATASVTRAAVAGIDAPVESTFGNSSQVNAVQGSDQNAAVSSDTTANQPSNNNTGQPLYGTYEVKSGDTLSKIANIYGTTVDALRTINDISGSLITVGQNVRYPLPAN